jgi:hypothetical protein
MRDVATYIRVTSLGIAIALCGLLVHASPVAARKTAEHTYRYEQVWSASVRMVRVDLRFEVQDQDEELGYLLFQYRDTSNRAHPGSFELVRTENARGQPTVRVVLQIPAMPSYIEQMLVDRLGRKLREEFGEPPAPPPREPPRRGPERQPDEEPDEGTPPTEGDDAPPVRRREGGTSGTRAR